MRFVAAAIFLLSLDTAVPAYVPSLGHQTADPLGACNNLTHYYNTTTNKERCCVSTAWTDCTPAVPNPFAGKPDGALAFIHPANTLATDVANLAYLSGSGQISIAGPTAPGLFITATGGAALYDYVEQTTGTAIFQGAGGGLSLVKYGSQASGPNSDFQAAGITRARLDGASGQWEVTASTGASQPALSFLGDTGTGLYRAAANEIGVSNGTTASIRFALASATKVALTVKTDGSTNNGLCISTTIPCNPTTSTGLFADETSIGSLAAGTVGQFFVYGNPLDMTTGIQNLSMDDTATCGTTTGCTVLDSVLAVGTAVTSSTAKIQTNGGVASTTPFTVFSVGPVAAFTAGLKLGSRKLGQRCTVTAASGKALTAGTGGTTAATITVTDGSNVCTLTSSSGCNAAIDADESFTATGQCAYASGATLNFTGIKGNCTTGPSFYNLVVDCIYQ